MVLCHMHMPLSASYMLVRSYLRLHMCIYISGIAYCLYIFELFCILANAVFSYLTSRYEKDFFFVPGYENAPFRTTVRNRLQKLRLQPFIYTHTLYATPHAGHNIKRYMRRNAKVRRGWKDRR